MPLPRMRSLWSFLQPHMVPAATTSSEACSGTITAEDALKAEEARYELSPAYQKLFYKVLEYCRESVEDSRGLRAAQQRVRHWGAIAILRSALSSPDAAAMVLGNRISRLGGDGGEEGESAAQIDETYRPQVLDLFGDPADYAPTGPVDQADVVGDARCQGQEEAERTPVGWPDLGPVNELQPRGRFNGSSTSSSHDHLREQRCAAS